MKTVLVTINTPGVTTGPTFAILSNVDLVTPLVPSVAKSSLLSGYSVTNVPDAATSIRVKSIGQCTTYVDLPVASSTTTTTTAAPTTTTSTTTTTAAPTTTTSTTSTTSTTTTTTIAPLYSNNLIVGDAYGSGYGYGQGYGSFSNGSSIPLFGAGATIYEFDYLTNSNQINFQIAGVPSGTPPTNWTTITIGNITYNRTQFNMSFGNPWWYFQIITTPSPFGTTVGATKSITIL